MEQVALEVVASAVDTAVDHAEEWVQDREARCITAHIGTDPVGTDQDLFLSLEDQDITARVALTTMNQIIKTVVA